MNYTLSKIEISNFRNISFKHNPNDYFRYNFEENQLVILGGKNGYGKTTLFSAIELLLTGEVKHIESGRDILNRGQVSASVMANDPKNDIVIIGYFTSSKNNKTVVKRTILFQEDYEKNKLEEFNGEGYKEIEEEDFFKRFSISKNIFHTAAYVSQSESLGFLALKYKDRKESISHIVSIEDQVKLEENLRKYKNSFNRKANAIVKEKRDELKKVTGHVETEQKKIEELSKVYGDGVLEYEKLFEKDYPFDQEEIDYSGIDYDVIIQEPKKILDYIKNKEEYDKYLVSQKLHEELERPKTEYQALFFRKKIVGFKEKESFFEELEKINAITKEELLDKDTFKQKVELLSKHKIIDEITANEYQRKLSEEQALRKEVSDTTKIYNDVLSERKKLIVEYKKGLEKNTFSATECVLCGSAVSNILNSIEDTTKILEQSLTGVAERLARLNAQKESYLKEKIEFPKTAYIGNHKDQLEKYNFLKEYFQYDIEKIAENFSELNLETFTFKDSNKLTLDAMDKAFIEAYQKHTEKLKEKLPSLGTDISKKSEEFKRIREEYYKNQTVHTEKQMKDKINYLSKLYNNALTQKMQNKSSERDKLKSRVESFIEAKDRKYNIIDTDHKMVEEELKKYQEVIAESIQIPLLIFSGKILQNYHLGLGIDIIVRENQLVFLPNNYYDLLVDSTEKLDVYNILSLGQLNALAMAIVLAINVTYSANLGLNCVLIDDPLQSIDDINSIAFADLLSHQFANKNIIMSTHEIEKARLLSYKYKQNNLDVKYIDVMQKYLTE